MRRLKNKLHVMLALCLVVMSMAVCFASGDGMTDFVNSINTGLSLTAIWGAISPIAPLMITLTLVAITRYVINKNLSKARKGGSGRV